MTNSTPSPAHPGVLFGPGSNWLKALTEPSNKARPLSLVKIGAEVARLTDEADRLSRDLFQVTTDDAALSGAFHRVGVTLRDVHTTATTLLSSLSDDHRRLLGLPPKKVAA